MVAGKLKDYYQIKGLWRRCMLRCHGMAAFVFRNGLFRFCRFAYSSKASVCGAATYTCACISVSFTKAA
jgi:hypothetical protein